MKIVLLEISEGLVDVLNVQVGRFNGSLFRKQTEEEKTYWDFLFVVGIAAFLKT